MNCIAKSFAAITFKNVGQGDSLIIEWINDGSNRVAIIDAKKHGKVNPVITQIEEKGYKIIDFILLSHPHEDHYSGILELLNYIEEKKIKVGWFGHTIDRSLGKEYWKLFESSRTATELLEKTLEKAIELKRRGVISSFELPVKNWTINLSGDIFLKAFSPSHEEFELYQRKVKLDAKVNTREASQAANLLSTVLALSCKEKHVLLTSDAESFSIDRIQNEEVFSALDLQLIQVPHHGSKRSYSSIFWNSIVSQKVAVISAGHNLKYKHPDKEVLDNLDGLEFTIHSTNICHSMIDFVKVKRASLLLDMISRIDESSFQGGDKVFKVE